MSYKVGVIRGDGIGPEIVAEALKVLDKVAEKYNGKYEYTIENGYYIANVHLQM